MQAWPILLLVVVIAAEAVGPERQKLSYLNKQKRAWLQAHLARSRRSVAADEQSSIENGFRHPSSSSRGRPCPRSCNCNFDTINCNDLIEQCVECSHWSKIDFNQIVQMRPRSFQHFRFATPTLTSPAHQTTATTHMIIYKLLNSTVGASTFEGMVVPRGAHVEITFQYNSLIRFDANALTGLRLDPNATLVFNFPYTTQVLFMAKCFEGVEMRDTSSKLIIRILKSFSVRFAGDFAHYLQVHSPFYKQPLPPSQANQTNVQQSSTVDLPRWSLANGQFIIDIKSTHLVKFDEYSMSHLSLQSNARLFIDLELIEKLMLQRHSFAKLEASGTNTRTVLFAKQITFIDFKAYSFSSMSLKDTARVEIYLEELTSSLCLQRHVFTNMRLSDSATFNFSIINSKNVQLMHHSFANVHLASAAARLFVGVFNMPSFILLFQNERFFKSFLLERLKYLNLPVTAVASAASLLGTHHQPLLAAHMHHNNHMHSQYAGLYVSQPFPANSEYFYASLNSDGNVGGGFDDDSVVYTMESELFNANHHQTMDLDRFYVNNKQVYSYNFSVERDCFYNLSTNSAAVKGTNSGSVVTLVADNVHTMFLDDLVFNISNDEAVGENRRTCLINFDLNLKHFVLSKKAFNHVGHVRVNFLKEPRVFKFGLVPSENPLFSYNKKAKQQPRFVTISGLSLVNSTNPAIVNFDYTYSDYFSTDGTSAESESTSSLSRSSGQKLGVKSSNKKEQQRVVGNLVNAFIDDFCQFKSIESSDTVIRVEPKRKENNIGINNNNNNELTCSCQIVYLLQNQLAGYTSLRELTTAKILPCKLTSFEFIETCMRQLDAKCDANSLISADSSKFIKGYIKFWEYCISEQEPLVKGSYMSHGSIDGENNLLLNSLQEGGTGGLYNFNDMGSLSSSLLDPSLDTHYKSSLFDPLSATGLDSGSPLAPATVNDLDDEFESGGDGHSTEQGGDSTANLPGSLGKIVGIVVICAVVAIILFMVAINIIQYKFRNDLFDDFECSSQNITSQGALPVGMGGGNRNSVSASGGSGGGGGRNCKSNVDGRRGRQCTGDDYNDYDSRNDRNNDDDEGPVGVECEEFQENLDRKQTQRQNMSDTTRRDTSNRYSKKDFASDRIDCYEKQRRRDEDDDDDDDDDEEGYINYNDEDDGYIYDEDYEYKADEATQQRRQPSNANESSKKRTPKMSRKSGKARVGDEENEEQETFLGGPEKVSSATTDSGKSSGFVSSSNSNTTITPVPSSYECSESDTVVKAVMGKRPATTVTATGKMAHLQKIAHAKNQIV